MTMEKRFILTYATCLILPKYDEQGKLFSIVYHANEFIDVDMKPWELIDYNLRLNGSSLRGAYEAAKIILEGTSMIPLAVNSAQNMYWFPSTSPTRDDCVWFALQNIRAVECQGYRRAFVTMHTSKIEVEMSKQVFKRRMQRAALLKYNMDNYVQKISVIKESKPISYMIYKDDKSVNYCLKKQEDEEES